MSKTERWTKQCRQCALEVEQEGRLTPAYYIPDDRELCNAHLLKKHGLLLDGQYDSCDTLGMGPVYYKEDDVLRVLTHFDNTLATLRVCRDKMASFSPIMWAEEIADADAAIAKPEEKKS